MDSSFVSLRSRLSAQCVRDAAKDGLAFLHCCKHVLACVRNSEFFLIYELRVRSQAVALPLLQDADAPLPPRCFLSQRSLRQRCKTHLRLFAEAEKGIALHCVEPCCAMYQRRVVRSRAFMRCNAEIVAIASYCQALSVSRDGSTVVAAVRSKRRVGRTLQLTPVSVVAYKLVRAENTHFERAFELRTESDFAKRVVNIACSDAGLTAAWVVASKHCHAFEGEVDEIATYAACLKTGQGHVLELQPTTGYSTPCVVPQEMWFDDKEALFVTYGRSACWLGSLACTDYVSHAYTMHGVALPQFDSAETLTRTPQSFCCVPLDISKYDVDNFECPAPVRTWSVSLLGLLTGCSATPHGKATLLLVDAEAASGCIGGNACYLFHPSRPAVLSLLCLDAQTTTFSFLSCPCVAPRFIADAWKDTYRLIDEPPFVTVPPNARLSPNGDAIVFALKEQLCCFTLSQGRPTNHKEPYSVSEFSTSCEGVTFAYDEEDPLTDVASISFSPCGESVVCTDGRGAIFVFDRRTKRMKSFFTNTECYRMASPRKLVWTTQGLVLMPSGASAKSPRLSKGGALMILCTLAVRDAD